MTDDEKKFTQADVDRIISERLQREGVKASDNTALRAEVDALKADLAAEKAARQKIEADRTTAAVGELKAKIARELNLPEKLVPRVTGTTEEEIRADMKVLVESIGPGPAVGAGTNPATPASQRFTKQQIERMPPEEVTKNWATIEAQLKDGSLNSAG
jgi:hypothetical protein